MKSTAINTVYVVMGINLTNGYRYISQIFFREDKALEYTKKMNNLYLPEERTFWYEEKSIW